jgi:hypothetical protein
MQAHHLQRAARLAQPLLALASMLALGCASCSASPPPPASEAPSSAAPGASATTATPSATPAPTSSANAGAPSVIELPDGAPGIGFDDLRFAPALGQLLVPAGRSGKIDLLDPATRALTPIAGFSVEPTFAGGHDTGVTSADLAGKWLFATDRSSRKLALVDLARGAIVASAPLAAGPDYVRFVAPTGEAWVTEPDADQIEIFSVPVSASAPVHVAVIATRGGPESLVIDATRGRAYAHLWKGATIAIDLRARAIVETWPNGCEGSRGIALDEARGFLFAGCAEGKLVVLDVAHGGKQLSSLRSGNGVDIIDFSPSLSHAYLPGAKSATMALIGVSASGQLSLLDTVSTAQGAHCVAADAAGNAYVCDPAHGRLLAFHDGHPASR